MKNTKLFTAAILTAIACVASPLLGTAQDKKPEIKPYTLDTCIVSGEKLGEMGKAFVFTNGVQEIKLCCKSCKKDFDKDPAKYTKKLDEAIKKADADKKAKK